jgi:K+-sensing histidine kinase KdpD
MVVRRCSGREPTSQVAMAEASARARTASSSRTRQLLQHAAGQDRSRSQTLDGVQQPEHTMVSWLSHELKTPLAAIKASATALLSDTTILGLDTDVRRGLAESIDRETDRLTRLVISLLDLSRIEAGAPRPQLEWVPMS